MYVNLTAEERDLMIDALEVYRQFLVDRAADEQDDEPQPGDPDWVALDTRARSLILRLEVAHQRKDDPTPMTKALQELSDKEDKSDETEERGSSDP